MDDPTRGLSRRDFLKLSGLGLLGLLLPGGHSLSFFSDPGPDAASAADLLFRDGSPRARSGLTISPSSKGKRVKLILARPDRQHRPHGH